MPEAVLYDWLSCILLEPAAPTDHTARVIHAEIELLEEDEDIRDWLDSEVYQTLYPPQENRLNPPSFKQAGLFVFAPKTDSGKRLLKTLVSFCQSYDQWQFSRWLHHVNASDFSGALGEFNEP
ncbi:MAG: hypothetical protein VKJ04_09355 [Vampirovibrionales bacterium]|nr:hypothetical protein [Vampirovibrionales bacterium]